MTPSSRENIEESPPFLGQPTTRSLRGVTHAKSTQLVGICRVNQSKPSLHPRGPKSKSYLQVKRVRLDITDLRAIETALDDIDRSSTWAALGAEFE